MFDILRVYGEAARTALGFFWKAGWAFVLGYAVSAMIQAFVPKGRLTPFMGRPDAKSVSIATVFGAASSSCSFAALATARALILKGAHFVAGVAFMFASTNLVIELGILILIFLGWQYLAAEIVGGIVLIIISSLVIRVTYPREWIDDARKDLEQKSAGEEGEFDWRRRIRTREGWYMVGHHFVSEWKMVWQEIFIGFTAAGFIAVLVPHRFWEMIFLTESVGRLPEWLIALENAMVAPFVAAATFIGSMGNIPLATVLNANGVLFAGIMGFIYSDLMVPPLVMVNAKYYGKRVALYIAGVMFVSIVLTALILNYTFGALDIIPESSRAVGEVSRFAFDYTFFLNLGFAAAAGLLVYLSGKHERRGRMEMGGGGPLKRRIAYSCMGLLAGGIISYFMTGMAGG